MGTVNVIAVAYQVQPFLLQIEEDSAIYVLDIIFGRVYDVISHFISIFYSFFKLQYLWNQRR